MRIGIRNFCNGDGSTSTLSQEKPTPFTTTADFKQPTLEQMILQLEMEEELARKSKIAATRGGRMSNCDILRSARNALNQYPRFSLDGRDAMYRCSFRNFDRTPARHSVCCNGREQLGANYSGDKRDVKLGMPAILAGESVVWCKPGVIGKLMGLDAMPIPISNTKGALFKSVHMNAAFQRHRMDHRARRNSDCGSFMNGNTRVGCFSSSSSSSNSFIRNRNYVKNRF